MKKLIAVLAVLALGACGGSSSNSPTTLPTPAPTPTPSASGTYAGTMTFTGNGLNAVPVTGNTTVTQTGSSLAFSNLVLSGIINLSLGLGSTTLNGNAFDGQGSYSSAGCGVVTSHFVGHFAGNLMNLTVTLTPEKHGGGCGVYDIRGEMSR